MVTSTASKRDTLQWAPVSCFAAQMETDDSLYVCTVHFTIRVKQLFHWTTFSPSTLFQCHYYSHQYFSLKYNVEINTHRNKIERILTTRAPYIGLTLKRPPYVLGHRRPPGAKCDPTMKMVITNAGF